MSIKTAPSPRHNAPPVATDMAEPGRRGIRSLLLPLSVLAISLAATYGAWRTEQKASRQELLLNFDLRVRETVDRVQHTLWAYEQVLYGTRGLFTSSQHVSQEEFGAYFRELTINQRYPGIQDIGFAPLVPHGQRSRHIAEMRRQGCPDYTVRPDGEREWYAPIVYLESFKAPISCAMGFDMRAEAEQRAAMERARDSDAASITTRIRLVENGSPEDPAGFVLYLPLYQPGQPHDSLETRRAHITGWVYARILARDLMANLVGHLRTDLDIAVHDGGIASADNLIYASGNPSPVPVPAILENRLTMTVAGRPWTLVLRSQPTLESRLARDYANYMVVTGTLLSLLLSLLTWTLHSGRLRALALARQMTRELSESERRFRTMADAAPTLIWLSGEDKGCDWFNQTWLSFTGRSLAEESGNGWAEGVHPEDYPRCLDIYTSHFDRREPFAMEYRLRRHDGEYRWLLDNGVPRLDENGRFCGYIGSCIDITPQKQAEAATFSDKQFIQATLNGLTAQICVLDERGGIVLANQAWKDFRLLHQGGAAPIDEGPGYRAACAILADSALDTPDADAIGNALRDILAGRQDRFEMEYRCRLPGQARWFVVRLSKMQHGGQVRVIASHQDITRRKAMEEALRQSEERWKFALEGAGEGVWDWDIVEDIISYSPSTVEILGCESIEIGDSYEDWIRLVHPDDAATLRDRLRACLDGETERYECEYRILYATGDYRWIQSRGKVIQRDEAGAPLRMVGTRSDITERKRADERAYLLLAALEVVDQGVVLTDTDAHIQWANPAFETLTGYAPAEAQGRKPSDLIKSGLQDQPFYQTLWATILAGENWRGEVINRRKDGSLYHEDLSIAPVRNVTGTITHFIGIKRDVTERKRMEAELRQLATTDFLTGIPNRRHFIGRAENEMARLQRFGQLRVSLLMLDLDYFKRINDSFGHAIGDAVLKHVTQLIRQGLRKTDTLGRLGGEEFAVLLVGADLRAAGAYANRLRRRIAETPLQWDGQTIAVTASIGVTEMMPHDASTDAALARADEALYRAKTGGRNRVEVNEAPGPSPTAPAESLSA